MAAHNGQSIFKPAGAQQLIPDEVLARATKVLFITHFALGDFAYMQSCFRALQRAHPHLEVHVWVDERRRTRDPAKWPFLKKYAVYDWLNASPYVQKSYTRTYSPKLNALSIKEARQEAYPVILTFTNLDTHRYARFARKLSKDAYIVGLRKVTTRRYDILKHMSFRKLDASIPLYRSTAYAEHGAHISDVYADWFSRAFGIDIPKRERFPIMDIPEVWMQYARRQLDDWGFAGPATGQVIFVNAYSKCIDRCWPLERAYGLVREMRNDARWRDAKFVMNVVPEALQDARLLHAATGIPDTQLFCAEDHFFQLPAILSLCSLIITVETVVMHLANAVGVPVIALMRQTTPEWVPLDSDNSSIIWARQRTDWIDRITLPEVVEQVKEYSQHHAGDRRIRRQSL